MFRQNGGAIDASTTVVQFLPASGREAHRCRAPSDLSARSELTGLSLRPGRPAHNRGHFLSPHSRKVQRSSYEKAMDWRGCGV